MKYIQTSIGLEWSCCLEDELKEIQEFFRNYFTIETVSVNSDCDIYIRFYPYSKFDNRTFTSLDFQHVVIRNSSAEQFCFEGDTASKNSIEWIHCPSTKTALLFYHEEKTIVAFITSSSHYQIVDLIRCLVINNEEYKGTMILHASGVVYNDSGIAFVGSKGAGKTTFSLDLAKQEGVYFFSGDKLFLRLQNDGIVMHPWPDYPHVGTGTIYADNTMLAGLIKKGYNISRCNPNSKILLNQYELCDIFNLTPYYKPVYLRKILLPRIENAETTVERIFHMEEIFISNLEFSEENRFTQWTKYIIPLPKRKQLNRILRLRNKLVDIPFFSLRGNTHMTDSQRAMILCSN